MVFLHFPSRLTDEEEMLQKKYEKLRRKKKALQMLNSPKPESPICKPIIKRTLEVKPDAKEVAKKLLKSGAISAIKVETKERQGFKRPKGLERKRSASDKPPSVSGYQPFSASQSSEDDFSSEASTPSRPPQVKKLYESFVSSKLLEDEIREDRMMQKERRERDRDGKCERPKQGNTVYVRGFGVTEELLKKTFEPIGTIVNLTMEVGKNCGFVTFEKIEQASKAIKDFDKVTTENGVMLSVSLARRQRLMPPLSGDTSSSWSSLSAHFSQKGSHEDKRSILTYDDMYVD